MAPDKVAYTSILRLLHWKNRNCALPLLEPKMKIIGPQNRLPCFFEWAALGAVVRVFLRISAV